MVSCLYVEVGWHLYLFCSTPFHIASPKKFYTLKPESDNNEKAGVNPHQIRIICVIRYNIANVMPYGPQGQPPYISATYAATSQAGIRKQVTGNLIHMQSITTIG